MDVSIIIVNYNTCQLTLQCLQSIIENTHRLCIEVIVVDNASVDDSVMRIREEYPQVILIESDVNLGFGKANNLGSKYANGKYLFLLNSDTFLKNNAVVQMFDFVERNGENLKVGAIGTLLLGKDGSVIHSFANFPRPVRILWDTVKTYFQPNQRSLYDDISQQSFFKVEYVTGADLFLSNELFQNLKGFDPDFFMYFEETDLQKRMAKQGLNCYIIRAPQIVHLEGLSFQNHSKSSVRVSNSRRLMYQKSMFLYIYKHCNIFTYFVFRTAYCFIRLISLIDPKYSMSDRWVYFKALFS